MHFWQQLHISKVTTDHTVTLTEDLIPLNIPKHTMVQAASRQQTMYVLKEPVSSIESVMSKALRYQKYDVGELFSHSGTGVKKTKKPQTLSLFCFTFYLDLGGCHLSVNLKHFTAYIPVIFPCFGHFSHGKGDWNEFPR